MVFLGMFVQVSRQGSAHIGGERHLAILPTFALAHGHHPRPFTERDITNLERQ